MLRTLMHAATCVLHALHVSLLQLWPSFGHLSTRDSLLAEANIDGLLARHGVAIRLGLGLRLGVGSLLLLHMPSGAGNGGQQCDQRK